MDVPRRLLAIVHRLHRRLTQTSQIATCFPLSSYLFILVGFEIEAVVSALTGIDPRLACLHGDRVDLWQAPLVELDGRHGVTHARVAESRAERAYDEVALETDQLVFVLEPLAGLVLLGAKELHGRDATAGAIRQHAAWRTERHELALLLFGYLNLKQLSKIKLCFPYFVVGKKVYNNVS